jgi:hypothetical protein
MLQSRSAEAQTCPNGCAPGTVECQQIERPTQDIWGDLGAEHRATLCWNDGTAMPVYEDNWATRGVTDTAVSTRSYDVIAELGCFSIGTLAAAKASTDATMTEQCHGDFGFESKACDALGGGDYGDCYKPFPSRCQCSYSISLTGNCWCWPYQQLFIGQLGPSLCAACDDTCTGGQDGMGCGTTTQCGTYCGDCPQPPPPPPPACDPTCYCGNNNDCTGAYCGDCPTTTCFDTCDNCYGCDACGDCGTVMTSTCFDTCDNCYGCDVCGDCEYAD